MSILDEVVRKMEIESSIAKGPSKRDLTSKAKNYRSEIDKFRREINRLDDSLTRTGSRDKDQAINTAKSLDRQGNALDDAIGNLENANATTTNTKALLYEQGNQINRMDRGVNEVNKDLRTTNRLANEVSWNQKILKLGLMFLAFLLFVSDVGLGVFIIYSKAS